MVMARVLSAMLGGDARGRLGAGGDRMVVILLVEAPSPKP
jgi:hypothetical protein